MKHAWKLALDSLVQDCWVLHNRHLVLCLKPSSRNELVNSYICTNKAASETAPASYMNWTPITKNISMPIILPSLPGHNTEEPWRQTIMTRTKTTDLIVDFPHNRTRRVRFAGRTQVIVFKRHYETHNVARHELWYTDSEYHQMRVVAETRKRLAYLRAQRSLVSFTRNQTEKFCWRASSGSNSFVRAKYHSPNLPCTICNRNLYSYE